MVSLGNVHQIMQATVYKFNHIHVTIKFSFKFLAIVGCERMFLTYMRVYILCTCVRVCVCVRARARNYLYSPKRAVKNRKK